MFQRWIFICRSFTKGNEENLRVKYVFFFNFQWILELVHFENQFSFSSFKICGFSLFNQILFSLVDISSAFHNSIWLNIKTKMCETV